MEKLIAIFYIFLYQFFDVYGENLSTVVPIDIKLNGTTKSALRYGFHKTSECLKFEISYLCIQKCLDLNYDVAYADKNCKCTCYTNKDKAKYSPKYNFTRTNWKLGAPTTSIPAWAQEKVKTNAEDNKSEESQLSHEIDLDDQSSASEPQDALYFSVTDSVNTLETESAASTVGSSGETTDSQTADTDKTKIDESTVASDVGENTNETKVDGAGNATVTIVDETTEGNTQSISNATENVEKETAS